MVEMYRYSKTCLRADTIRLKRAGGAREQGELRRVAGANGDRQGGELDEPEEDTWRENQVVSFSYPRTKTWPRKAIGLSGGHSGGK